MHPHKPSKPSSVENGLEFKPLACEDAHFVYYKSCIEVHVHTLKGSERDEIKNHFRNFEKKVKFEHF